MFTRQVEAEAALCYRVSSQLQLTPVFPSALQGDGQRERDVRQVRAAVCCRAGGVETASIVNDGQSKGGPRRHVHLTAEQRVIVTGEVEDHGVWNEMHEVLILDTDKILPAHVYKRT